MKSRILTIATMMVCWFAAVTAFAQDATADPVITLRTHRYETSGENNMFQMSLMCNPGKTVDIKVDFGNGEIRHYQVTGDGTPSFGDDDELVGGSVISGTVAESGLVRVWCDDPTIIDYMDAHGSEIYELDITKLTGLEILSLSHNGLHHLDLSEMHRLMYLEVADNPFDEGFELGDNHPDLYYLNVNQLGDKALPSGTIDISRFPKLQQFQAWDSKCLLTLDPSHNQYLQRISVDNSGVRSIDISQNPVLFILNVSDCGFTSVDVSNNEYLVELYCTNEGQEGDDRKLSSIDVTHNPHLQRLMLSGNNLTELDLSNVPNLITLDVAHNHFSHIDVSMIDSLASFDISVNDFDFSNLPEVDPMTYFYYDFQRDLQVDPEYCVGGALDLSKRVLREGTMTICGLFSENRCGIEDPVLLQEGFDYTYEEGVITFLRPQEDDVFAAFLNDVYTGVTLYTTRFRVRSEADFGKPVELFSFVPADTIGSELSWQMKMFNTDQVFINAGNGNIEPLTLTDENVSVRYLGGRVMVLAAVGARLESLNLSNIPLYDVNLEWLTDMTSLTMVNDSLTDIDLGWNNRLKTLVLDNNHLKSLNLDGVNSAFNKNILTHLSAKGNNISHFEDIVAVTLVDVDLSDNELEEISLSTMANIRNLNLSGNKLGGVDVSACEVLESLNLDNNQIVAFSVDSCPSLINLDIRHNRLRPSTLPLTDVGNYLYAPQQPIKIATAGAMVNLSEEGVVNGVPTVFTWIDAETGSAFTEGTDYTISNGITMFTDASIGRTAYCELANELFPAADGDNSFRTTVIRVIEAPKHVVASFVTPIGDQEAHLSLAAVEPDTYIYIDWGDGELHEFALQTTYQLFTGTTVENGEVRVLSSYTDDGGVSVFSIGGVKMSSVDVSNLTKAICITLNGAGLESIDLSHNTVLRELDLGGNELHEIDLSHNPNLGMVYLNYNHFSDLDVTASPGIYMLMAAYNGMNSVNITGLSDLNVLDLTHNNLSEIDLSTNTSLYQIALAENNLSSIDLSNNHWLNVVDLNDNNFTLATLPVPGQWSLYYYANQAPLPIECSDDARVDLSSQFFINGVQSQIYWFTGDSIEYGYDYEGNLMITNEELTEGVDFTVDNTGVVTFAANWPKVFAYISNELFPKTLFFTEGIAVSGATGIEQISDNVRNGELYSLDGRRLMVRPSSGIFISNGGIIVK